MAPPRVGALWLWVLLASFYWATSRLGGRVLRSVSPAPARSGGLSPFADLPFLLRWREGRRLVLHTLPLSGGEALCALAKRNGEATTSHRDCGPKRAFKLLTSGTPAQQCASLRAQPLSFLLLAGGLADAPWRDGGALHLLTLRHPHARLLAEADALLADGRRQARLGLNGSASRLALLSAVAAAPVPLPLPLQDNPLTRALAGASARAAPLGGVTASHAAEATSRLAAFDLLLFSDALQGNVVTLAQLAGWRYWDVTMGDKQRSSAVDPLLAELGQLPHAERALIHGHTAMDVRVFQAAVALARSGRPNAAQPRNVTLRCEDGDGQPGGVVPAPRWGYGWADIA